MNFRILSRLFFLISLALAFPACGQMTTPDTPNSSELQQRRGASPVFGSSTDCRAIISRNFGLCQSKDCEAMVLRQQFRCTSSDCEAMVLGLSSRCSTRNCRAVTLRSQGFCSNSICRAIVTNNNALCFGR